MVGHWVLAMLCGLLCCTTQNSTQTRPQSRTDRGCQSCHSTPGPAGLHGALGCEACHLGDPEGTWIDAAHRGLEREPGALDTVDQTCGSAGCHVEQTARLRSSLMATGAGIIAVDRWAFGEQPLPDGHESMAELLAAADPSPAQDHLRRLCAGCHLHSRKDNRDDAIAGIGSGCSACHSASRQSRWDAHPSIDLVVPDDRCLGCHSRSGRISLSYQGLAEARGVDCAAPLTLHDGRPGCRQAADVHHQGGLSCTDCHLHTELMGDGQTYAHEEQAVELSCQACHGPDAAETTWAQVDDATSRTLLRQHGQTRPADEAVRLGKHGTPIWNLRPTPAGAWALQPKAGGDPKVATPTPSDATHALAGHQRLACGTCHTQWVPICADCHTQARTDGEQWDFGAGALAPGQWVETAAHFGFGQPALGVLPDGRIDTVIPGMIWSLDASAVGGPTTSTRRFAASQPHTTGKVGRDCESCHRSAVALGLGTGTLDVEALRFEPQQASPDDPGLAVDGWVPLQPTTPGRGTRTGLRSLDAAEQRAVLRVGLCLPCHGSADDQPFGDFQAALDRMATGRTACEGTLPAWAGTD